MDERAAGDREAARDQSREVARIAAFSDGVFAIAITLLALQLQVPAGRTVDVAHYLGELLPNMLSFVISFLVIGTYWVAHHRLFAVIERYDVRLIWLNMLTLFCIVILPFTTSLVGEHGDQKIAVAAYAISLAIGGIANTATAAYALVGRRLCGAYVSARMIKYYLWRGLVVSVVFLLSLLLLPLGTSAVQYSWLGILAAQWVVRRRFASPGEA